ncbi:hypothetical protein [Caballeronia hypogeia]|uniref:hypothetical protein n=1 Tax=Caballeronia hypogeia TaxID=1777140 RepID=UPI0007723A5D|nr:hypothetical protein [Caballeronia hypogeia]
MVLDGVPPALQLFGTGGLDHMNGFGTPLETFAKILAKASRRAANIPMAVFRTLVTPEGDQSPSTRDPAALQRPPIWAGAVHCRFKLF